MGGWKGCEVTNWEAIRGEDFSEDLPGWVWESLLEAEVCPDDLWPTCLLERRTRT